MNLRNRRRLKFCCNFVDLVLFLRLLIIGNLFLRLLIIILCFLIVFFSYKYGIFMKYNVMGGNIIVVDVDLLK